METSSKGHERRRYWIERLQCAWMNILTLQGSWVSQICGGIKCNLDQDFRGNCWKPRSVLQNLHRIIKVEKEVNLPQLSWIRCHGILKAVVLVVGQTDGWLFSGRGWESWTSIPPQYLRWPPDGWKATDRRWSSKAGRRLCRTTSLRPRAGRDFLNKTPHNANPRWKIDRLG